MLRIIKKFALILNTRQKINLFIIVIMMLIGGVLETCSVTLIIPLVTAMTQPNIIQTNQYARWICDSFHIHSTNQFAVLMIISLAIIFIGKNLFLLWEYYFQYKFVFYNRYKIQKKILTAYLNRPYEFYLDASSAEIIRVITSDVSISFSLLTTLLNFFTELIVSIALIITIIAVDFTMAFMIVMLLSSVLLIIYLIVKPILRKKGIQYQFNAAMVYKWVLQSISGIKELKVAMKEDYFLEQFGKYGKGVNETERQVAILSNIPKLAIEAVSMSGMLLIIAIFILMGHQLTSMLPQLSAFVMAAVRLLPSAYRISSGLNIASYQEPMLDKMIESLNELNQWQQVTDIPQNDDNQCKAIVLGNIHKKYYNRSDNKVAILNKKIRLAHITYVYPNSDQEVLTDVSMDIPLGKSIGIIGASGAGKTTVVDILLGLLKPRRGQVLFDGVDIQHDYKKWLTQIAYIPQMIYMLDDSIRVNVAFGLLKTEIDDDKVWKALEEAQLDSFVRSLPDGLDTTIGERGIRISGGQRQRIGIARALYINPEILIFDEATSALDNETEAAIMESINHLHGKKTMVIIAHRLTTIKSCDIVYRVENGTITIES